MGEDLVEEDMIRTAADAGGILFPIRPAGTEKLVTAYERLPSL